MNKFLSIFSLSIGRKLLMALTGLFLVVFLLVHVSGNLQLFKHDNGLAFNTYSVFMTTNPLIKTVSYLLYATIILHSILALVLTLKNMGARKSKYAVSAGNANSKWYSRNMGILGTLLLAFLIIHMSNFWYEYKFKEVPWAMYTTNIETSEVNFRDITEEVKKFPKKPDYKMQEISMEGQQILLIKDLYKEVKYDFENELWIVVLYVLAMFAVGFHLLHGFRSAFQTLGINHPTYSAIIKTIGIAFSIIVPVLFAAMPLYFYIGKMIQK